MATTGEENMVKSRAVVKFDPFNLPEQFNRIAPLTDLHKPPEDWLNLEQDVSRDLLASVTNPVIPMPHMSSSASVSSDEGEGRKGGGSASALLDLVSNPAGGSFHMAYNNVDMVGDVDVIAHSDVVKKLIRLPFDKRQLSIMVHRIGKTLLLDEFDILALLIATEETEWQWIRDFVQSHVLDELKRKNLHIKRPYGRSTPAAVEHNMLSKFLHYSVVPHMLGSQTNFREETVIAPPDTNEVLNLPESILDDSGFIGTNKSEESSRTVLWEFENMQMLLGSNLPIFGGADHPVVSLRLHDDSKPINVLTGLDYWLDNLICNVPELAMCFHINGIVQKYEVYKTMDIPNLENSKFSPTAVRDIAQNILSFLNNNCTKEGHTYWLFKPHGDEIVKLYDLTSICETASTEQEEGGGEGEAGTAYHNMNNPFAIPVAFLLYRVAKNLVAKFAQDNERSSKVRDTVYSLLRNALKLIQDVRSKSDASDGGSGGLDPHCRNLEGCIYFLLVQLYIPSGPWKDWAAGSEDSESVDDLGSECEESFNTEMTEDNNSNSTSGTSSNRSSPGSNSSKREDRQDSTKGSPSSSGTEDGSDVFKGVSIDRKSLLKSDRSLLKEHRKAHEYSHLDLTIEERCRSALDYTLKCFQFLESYKFQHKTSSASNENETSLISVNSSTSWKNSIKCSLQYKLAVILSTFGLQCFDTGKYGRAYRYLKLALAACCSINYQPNTADVKSEQKRPPPGEGNTCEEDVKSGSLLLGKILQLLGDVFVLFANCANSPEQTELHIEEGLKGHTAIELQLSCFLTPNNNEIYAKMDQFSICGGYAKCIESAASIYSLCREHMRTSNHVPLPPSSASKATSNYRNGDVFATVLERRWNCPYNRGSNKNAVAKVEKSSKNRKSNLKGATTNGEQGQNGSKSSVDTQLMSSEVSVSKKTPASAVIDVEEWAFRGEEALLKRLGNVNNELGRMYENRLMERYSSTDDKGDMVKSEDVLLLAKSHFEKAQEFFTQIGDRANVGLVLGNTGRLCRIWAHLIGVQTGQQTNDTTTTHADTDGSNFKSKEDNDEYSIEKEDGAVSSMEKSYYYKAIEYYRQALANLEHSGDQSLLSNLTWDLCSTHFTLGRLIQDNSDSLSSTKSRERAKQEVIDNLTKAMKYCIPPSNIGAKLMSEQDILIKERHLLRLGEIHQGLGTLYHHAYRYKQNADKSMHALAEFHYSKAADCFHLNADERFECSSSAVVEKARLERDDLYARVQLERVALIEFQLTNITIPKLTCRMLNSAVALLNEAFTTLERLEFQSHSLSTVFIAQLRKTLLTTIKFYSPGGHAAKKSSKKEGGETQFKDKLKAVYAKSLKIHNSDTTDWRHVLLEFKNVMILIAAQS